MVVVVVVVVSLLELVVSLLGFYDYVMYAVVMA